MKQNVFKITRVKVPQTRGWEYKVHFTKPAKILTLTSNDINSLMKQVAHPTISYKSSIHPDAIMSPNLKVYYTKEQFHMFYLFHKKYIKFERTYKSPEPDGSSYTVYVYVPTFKGLFLDYKIKRAGWLEATDSF